MRKPPKPFKRGDYYHYAFSVRRVPFRSSTHCKTLREAEAVVLDVWKKAHSAPVEVKPELPAIPGFPDADPEVGPTVGQVFKRHWETELGDKPWGEIAKYHIREIIASVGSSTPWRDISNATIASFVEAREAKGRVVYKRATRPAGMSRQEWLDRVPVLPVRIGDVGPVTINRALAVWRRAYNRARLAWELECRPISWTEHMEDEPKERVRALSHDEAKRLADACPPHVALAVAFALATGMRRNELYTLVWGNVDFENRVAHVKGKGLGGRTRPVALNAEALAVLGMRYDETVAPLRDGFVFDGTNRRKLFAKALDEAGITDFHWHDLRHTFATWAGRAGMRIEVLATQMGHGRVETTRRYRHVLSDEVGRAVDRVPGIGFGNVRSITAANPPSKPVVEIEAENVHKIVHSEPANKKKA